MKENFESKLNLLSDLESPMFCGSSVFLSLFPVLEFLSKKIVDFKEGYPELKKVNERLYQEDPVLFEYSKKKEDFLDVEWKEILSILQDYEKELIGLDSLARLCKSMGLESYATLLHQDSIFLKKVLQETLTIFFEREDKVPEYERIASNCLMAIRGE
jgi:hypothetical protein